jgi:hypothetical protein
MFILKSANQKKELPVVAMFVNGSGQNVQSLERTAHRCFLQSFGSFGLTVSDILFSKPCQRQYELLPSLGVRRLSSVNFSDFNLLL